MRRILIVTLCGILGACAAARAHFAMFGHRQPAAPMAAAAPASPPAPKVAEGLWAILDPGCPKPGGADLSIWPRCASPFWIHHGTARVMRSAAAASGSAVDHSYATDFRVAAGDPMIVRVGSARDGYMFLALTDLGADDRGQVISASGAPVACPKVDVRGRTLRPNLTGCESETLDTVRKAAAATLQDSPALTHVAWIASGSP